MADLSDLKAKEQPNPTDIYQRLRAIRNEQDQMIEQLKALGDETAKLAQIWDDFNAELKKTAEEVGMNTPK